MSISEDIPIWPTPNHGRILEETLNVFNQVVMKIFGPGEHPIYSHPSEGEFKRALKAIRMAQNYGESYEVIKARIKEESALYAQFKKSPQPIGKITLNFKRLDSKETSQKQYEVNRPLEGQSDPEEGKASVSYTYQRSPDTVLEFVLHDEKDEPLFAIARTYCDWLGCKEFDLGQDRAFYLNMVEAKPGYVAVQAGFKAKEAAVPAITFPDAETRTSGKLKQVLGAAADAWPFRRKMALVVATQLVIAVLCCSMFQVVANSNQPVAGNGSKGEPAEEVTTAFSGSIPHNNSIVARYVIKLLENSVTNGLVMGGETTGPRRDQVASRSKRLARVTSVAVTVNSASLDESVRCSRELITRLQEGVDVNSRKPGGVEPLQKLDCGNAVNFVVSYQPIERNDDNFLFSFLDDSKSLFDSESNIDYEGLTEEKLVATTNEFGNLVLALFTGHQDPRSGSDEKGNEVSMTK